jgi:hypothetical protein
MENLRPDPIVAWVAVDFSELRGGRLHYRIDCGIGLQVLHDFHAAISAVEVENHSPSFFRDHFHGPVQLPTGLVVKTPENVSEQALRVYSHQGRLRCDYAFV